MKDTTKNILRRLAPWAALLILLAGFAVVRGLEDCFVIDYNITNGDFQNYNPVRHLLAGQAPYADFTVYLGAGELYGMAAILLLVGNTFARSMFAAEFLTWFCFELLVLAVCRAVFRTGRAARAMTAALSAYCLLAVQGTNLPGMDWLRNLLGYASSSGNSARMIRSGGAAHRGFAVRGGPLPVAGLPAQSRRKGPAEISAPRAPPWRCPSSLGPWSPGATTWAHPCTWPYLWLTGCSCCGSTAQKSGPWLCGWDSISSSACWDWAFPSPSSAGDILCPGCARPGGPRSTSPGITPPARGKSSTISASWT